jgi:hypothetical protein
MKTQFQIFYLVALNVFAMIALAFLVQRGIVTLYPSGVIAFLLFFVVNLIIVLKIVRQRTSGVASGRSTPSILAAVVFTLAGIAAVVAFVREPNVAHGVQVAVAVLLVGYIWYIMRTLRRMRKGQIPK